MDPETLKTKPFEPFPYQQIDGLKAIYIGMEEVPHASFVFETAEKADICSRAVIQDVSTTNLIGRYQHTTDFKKAYLEVLRGTNLSNELDEFVLSYSAKTMGTVGKPIKTAHQLLNELGFVMRSASYSKEIHAVPIYAVDSHLCSPHRLLSVDSQHGEEHKSH